MLNLYYNPLSTFSHKVLYFAFENEIPYKLNVVDLMKGEQAREAFQKVNAFGQVPAIELNGFTLGESNAILRYLAQRCNKSAWYPENLEERAEVDRMSEFTNLHVNRWLASLHWNIGLAPKFSFPVDNHAIKTGREQLLKTLPKLDRHLHGRNYLCGATPTIADAVLLPFMANHAEADVSLTDFQNVRSWNERMTARPAWRKVVQENERLLSGR